MNVAMPLRAACLWLGSTAILGTATPVQANRSTFTFVTDTAVAVGRVPRLTVENQSGRVLVSAGRGDSLRVRILRHVPAADSATAATFLDRLQVDWERGGEGVNIAARVKRSARELSFFRGIQSLHELERGSIDLEITLPSPARLEVRTRAGAQAVDGVEGDIALESKEGEVVVRGSGDGYEARRGTPNVVRIGSSSGQVRVRNVQGHVVVRGGSGDVLIEQVHGDVQVSSSSGRVDAIELSGALEAATTSGGIDVRGLVGPANLRSTSGAVAVNLHGNPLHRVDVKTGSGDVELDVPPDLDLAFELISGDGSIDDRLGEIWLRRTRHEWFGRLGKGDIPVRIETGSGDIRLRSKT
jgi:hypothetical protein